MKLSIFLILIILSSFYSLESNRPACFSTSELLSYNIKPSPRYTRSLVVERQTWPGHYFSTALGTILLEEALGFKVTIADLPDGYGYINCGGGGTVHTDLNFEIWPSSTGVDQYTEWVTTKGLCNDGGSLGVIGRSGWYIPSYTVSNHPNAYLDFWRAYDDTNKYYFPTAGTTPDDLKTGHGKEYVPPWCALEVTPSGCQLNRDVEASLACTVTKYNPNCTELLGVDVAYDGGILQQQIYNNKLNLIVPFLGSNFNSVLNGYLANQTNVLFYYWSPSDFIAGSDFVRVALRDASDICYSNHTRNIDGTGSVNCDFQSQILTKTASAALSSSFSDATRLIKTFALKNSDQINLLKTINPAYTFGEADFINNVYNSSCSFLKTNANRWLSWIYNTPAEPFRYTTYLSDDTKSGILALAIILSLVSVALHFLIEFYSSHPIIKGSAISFLHLILFGTYFAYASMVLNGYREKLGVCSISYYFLSIAFLLIYGCCSLKTWRISQIFNNTSKHMAKVRITNEQLYIYLGIMILLETAFHLIWYFVDPPSPTLIADAGYADKLADFYSCSSNSSIWTIIAIATKISIIVYSVYLAWSVRKAPGNFNESKYLGVMFYNMAFVCLIFIPLLMVFSSINLYYYLFFAIAVLIGVFFSVCILFLPKFLVIFDLMEEDTLKKSTISRSAASVTDSSGSVLDDVKSHTKEDDHLLKENQRLTALVEELKLRSMITHSELTGIAVEKSDAYSTLNTPLVGDVPTLTNNASDD